MITGPYPTEMTVVGCRDSFLRSLLVRLQCDSSRLPLLIASYIANMDDRLFLYQARAPHATTAIGS
jgi:hypothetical protein